MTILRMLGGVMVIGALLSTASLAARELYWLAGLDVVLPIYADRAKDGAPGPLVNLLGYDADGGRLSVLYLADRCYESWQAWPSPGQGGIRHLAQVDVRLFALIHESGRIRLETQPVSAWCTPVERD